MHFCRFLLLSVTWIVSFKFVAHHLAFEMKNDVFCFLLSWCMYQFKRKSLINILTVHFKNYLASCRTLFQGMPFLKIASDGHDPSLFLKNSVLPDFFCFNGTIFSTRSHSCNVFYTKAYLITEYIFLVRYTANTALSNVLMK